MSKTSLHDTEIHIEKASPREVWPLTYTERQMAAEQGLNPDSVAYNINLAFELGGNWDIQQLEKALAALIERYAVLRSYYPLENGEYVHKIAQGLSVPLQKIDCSFDEVPDRIKECNTPFVIEKAPLLRLHLFCTGKQQWVLHFCIHHIILDGASADVLMGDLWKLYQGETLPPVPLDYMDYAVWQRENADTEAGERFFKDMFADGIPENEMPTHAGRPEVLPFANMDCEKVIPADAVGKAARRYEVTTFTLLLAALGITLAKYCGSEDVVVGSAMSGRNLKQTADIVGMFVNTLPLRLGPAGDLPAAAYVQKVREVLQGVKSNQTYPFERLVPMLAPDRNASRSPVFDVILNYLHKLPVPSLPGLAVNQLPIQTQALAMDLVLEVTHRVDNLRIVLSYSKDLYQDEIVEGFMRQFLAVLERLTAGDGTEELAEIAELPPEQRKKILVDFAGEKSDENLGKTIVELFRSRAKAVPENKAVVCGDTIFTYRELDEITDRLAAALAHKGADRGGVVGVLVDRSEMMPIGGLGTLKSGAAYLPLDPGYPSERLDYMLEDAGAKLLLVDRGLESKVPNYTGEMIFTDTLKDLPEAKTLPLGPQPEDTLILLYTSGTTGKPKGVELTHRNLTNFCSWYCRQHRITEKDNIPAYASFGFDACMMDLYPTLISGACVHIISAEMRLDLVSLSQYFNEHGISVAFMTTQLGRQFAESMENHTLRALSVGGETLVPIEPPGGYGLYNVYGPTECTVLATYFKVDKLYDRVPIGRAVANTSLYVIDGRGRLAPVGTAGELCIAGRQVGKGYLNRPDLTDEKFVTNPFSEDPDYSKMYRTGDVVRFLPDGSIDFVGRRDFQVKIRGFRVELTEIEGRIRAYPGILDAAVIAQDAPGGGKQVVAYVVANEPVPIKDLNRFIEEELPYYMVPAATMQIGKIPLNPNGKVDRKALPKVEIEIEEIVQPETELQKEITEITAQVIGTDNFGITTDLLYAGLHSLSAIKLAANLATQLGKTISAGEIMREKTVEKIAALLETGDDYTQKEYAKQEMYPLTQNQMGLYFACVKDPASLVYNIPAAIKLAGNTDVEQLQKALRAVVEAHSYIKTCLRMTNNEVYQVRRDDSPVDIPVIDATEDEMAGIKYDFVRPFNFFEGPLFRLEIYRTPERVYLLLDFHHIVFDGASLDIFLRDLTRAYAGEKLEPEGFTSFDLALMEKETEEGEVYKKAKTYFENLLGDGEGATSMQKDKDSEEQEGEPRTVYALLPKEPVEDTAKKYSLTVSNLFLGAVSFTLSRFAGTKQVRFATITNGRDAAYLQSNMGMLVKTLPIVVDVPSEQEEAAYLDATQRRMFDTLQNQAYPYTHIASEHHFAPQILYTYEGGVVSRYQLAGQELTWETLELNKTKFPISITIKEEGQHYQVEVEYNDAQFEQNTMATLAECIAHMASQLTQRSGDLLGMFSIATKEQQERIAGFMGEPEVSKAPALHKLFEEHAEKTPDKPALVAIDAALTYKQLNEKANQLANALLAMGVEKEDRVAFLLPRDSRVLISMMGIIKAGCAFIPVDPHYPPERIEHILEDSDAQYILTDGKKEFENSLDINELLLEEKNINNPDVDVTPENLCYIIYTSGSTGKPKGVMLTHRGIINYVSPFKRNIQMIELLKHQASFVSVSTVSFDIFIEDAFSMLGNGLRLVLASEEQARNPVPLAELYAKTGANAINTTPSIILQYLELPEMQQAFARCKVIVVGAEKYPPALYTKLRSLSKGVIFNSYGPTEATIDCNAKALTSSENITVGPPESGVVEQVMDMDGNPLPVGVVGELWIGGAGVARGYLNKPELTAERFVEWEGVRFYKSGDLAKWTEDGEVDILGRNDSQIKLRGLRIELGEIENTLSGQDGIRSCTVLVKKIHGQEHLCAYYTADREIPADELREALAKTLTVYMVPTAYLQLDSMPVTPNGKIDTRALPEAKLMARTEYTAPETEAEKIYCKIFEKILGVDRVGAEDNFFDLGGTSLLVTQVTIDALNDGYEISYGDVFSNPTPRELAALADVKPVGLPEDDSSEYDYSRIQEVLNKNKLETLLQGEKRAIGNICLTGANGFLGIHVLREYILSQTGTAYCLVRSGKLSAEARLKTMLVYYFSDSYDDLFGSRIVVVDGDITSPALFEKLEALPIDTVVNCAANVKHFSAGTDIEDINVGGVANGVDFAKKKGCRYIQISTNSVAGMSVAGAPPEDVLFNENMLYFGQDLSNKYVNSKFMAERIVLEAAASGLDAKIMRVGNLMARSDDGEFQINFNTNSFLNQLKAYQVIGKIPYEAMGAPAEFSPIDMTARAILQLAQMPGGCTVFHPYNDHEILLGDVVWELNRRGIKIEPSEMDVFEAAYSQAMRDKDKAKHLSSLIAYSSVEHGKRIVPIGSENGYTSQALFRCGFKWPITSEEYLTNFIDAMKGLGFFDDEEPVQV